MSGCRPLLTGWAEGVEVDFMIDTGCQVTILATSVFERMCVSDPRVRSRLHPCGRRLVSDSSPLTIQYKSRLSSLAKRVWFLANAFCTCVTKHSNAFRTFRNWLKNSKCVWHEQKLHVSRLPLFANFDL